MSSSSIKVAVRCRPLFGQERPTGGLDIQNRRILLDSKTYDPDYTFPPTATQDDVFQACRPILQCVKEGMNGTIMVYGQTGTGKTYTMLGDCAEGRDGLVHKVVGEVLEYVQQKTLDGGLCALTLSMIEIYNERLTDMLAPEGEEEEVTLISGFPRFTHKVVLSQVDDAIRTIQKGLERRHTAATMMNDRSSRSHVVFIFDLEEHNAFTDQTDVAHLFMIDLAGSESLKKSQATGVAAGEAGKINKSLLALKSVFLALSNTNEATRPGHVPYRDSKLTELLQDSIGGTARTLMIACISSVGRDIEETKSTLLYAVKARSIRNTANTEREKLLVRLRSMEVENQKLRNRLQERVNERGGYFVTKEEHEQLQEVEASYGELKGAVEQLTRDRQCSEARMHIGESQVKVFRAMLEAKSEELQRFKEVYNEALRRFEHHAASLQRMVRGSVGEAKAAVQRSFADNYARLHSWRTELLNALEEPLPTTLTPLPENEETVVLSQHQHVSDALLTQRERESLGASPHERPNTPPTSTQQLQVPEQPVLRGANPPTPPASPKRNDNAAHSHHSIASVSGRLFGPSRSARGSSASTQRISAASGAAAVSASVSPTRRNNRPRAGPHASAASSRRGTPASSGQLPPSPSLAACHQPPLLPVAAQARDEESTEEERPISPPPVGTPSWSTALAQHDAQCLRIVQRVNQAVVGMLEECIGAFEQYSAQAALVEQRRRSGVQEAFERLRREVDAQIAVVQRAESASARDLGDAREALRGQLHTKLKAHPPVDAAPLQHVMRSACTEVVRHATHAFPHPCTPAPAEAVMDGIAARLQHCQTMFSVNALDPLSSSAIVLNALLSGTAGSSSASAASLAGSPLQGKPSSGWMGGALMTGDAALMPLLPTSSSTTIVSAAGGGISGSVGSVFGGDGAARQAARASLTPTATEETSSRGSSMVRETRSTTVPPAGGSASLQRRSVRGPSSLRPSTALSVVPVNRGVGRPGESKRGTQGAAAATVMVGRGKRTRSAASLSQGGDRPSPRTTPPPQRELQ